MAELKRLSFAVGMLILVVTGQKTGTIRTHKPGINDFIEGEIFIGEFAEGADLTLRATANTAAKRFDTITDAEARASSHRDLAQALDSLREHYPDLTPSHSMVVIHFEIYPEVYT